MTYNTINWKDQNWSLIEETVFKIQTQVYSAIKQKNFPLARNLQNFIINMQEAKLLSVKRVTEQISGKKPSGADDWLAINDKDKFSLTAQLVVDGTASPIRVVNIQKYSKGECRPLGISTIYDRCKQYLVKLALEPEAEAIFETNSYGFRPGRSAIDATSRIRSYLLFSGCSVWVFNADISKCFDRINHESLLKKMEISEPFYSQIKAWLQAGIFEEGTVFSSIEGTPQGGVISPLLANIALDGLQKFIFDNISIKFGVQAANDTLVIRYADDLIILAKSQAIIIECVSLSKLFVSYIGLEINENKIRVIQTITTDDKGKILSTPFDFLGFRFSQRYISKHKEFKFRSGFKTRYLVSVLPAPSRIQRHKASLSRVMSSIGKVEAFIDILNPRITGWCNYFRFSDSRVNRDLPRKLDLWLNAKARKFIRRTTKKRGKVPEFWDASSKDWILYVKTTINGKEITKTLRKYNAVKWSISSYKPILPNFSPFSLPTVGGCQRGNTDNINKIP